MLGEMIDKIDTFETPSEIIDLGKDHWRVTLDEKVIGRFVKCEFRF